MRRPLRLCTVGSRSSKRSTHHPWPLDTCRACPLRVGKAYGPDGGAIQASSARRANFARIARRRPCFAAGRLVIMLVMGWVDLWWACTLGCGRQVAQSQSPVTGANEATQRVPASPIAPYPFSVANLDLEPFSQRNVSRLLECPPPNICHTEHE